MKRQSRWVAATPLCVPKRQCRCNGVDEASEMQATVSLEVHTSDHVAPLDTCGTQGESDSRYDVIVSDERYDTTNMSDKRYDATTMSDARCDAHFMRRLAS